jgi:hypothetical protein
LAVAQNPVKTSYKQQTKPSRPDVGNEHGSIIITGLGEIVEVAFRAPLQHIEGSYKRPTAGFKNFALVASWAFKIQYAVSFLGLLNH